MRKKIVNVPPMNAIALCTGLALQTPVYAGVDLHDSVASDGTLVPQSSIAAMRGKTSGRSSPPFAGLADITPADLYRDGAVDVGKTLSPDEVRSWAALPVGGTESRELSRPETIIGVDRREQVYTTNFPARARILVIFSAGRCSGTLIGADTVITAGHCLHQGNKGTWFPVDTYRIIPGLDGKSLPYGFCRATALLSVAGWTSQGNADYDYGAIKLDCTIGNTVGWYGYTSSVSKDDPAIIGGYPGDKPLTHWLSADKIRSVTTRRISYNADTYGGDSGSAVWWDNNGAYMVGVHSRGTPGSGNQGIRITSEVKDNFDYWKER